MRKHLKVFNSLDDLDNYYDEAKWYFVGYKKQNQSEVRYEKLYTSNLDKTVVIRNSINNKDMIVKESDYYKRYIFDNRYKKCDYLTFTGNGTKYTATIKGEKVILKGNHKNDKFIKNMIKAGVVGKATVK